MNEHDSVAVLLKMLDQPVAPRPEFADALRRRLLAELPEANGHRAWPPRLTLPPRPRRPRRVLVAAVAIALTAGALAAVLLSRPAPASALDVIRRAQQQAASLPPFQATLVFDINPDGTMQLVPKGATETMRVSYGGPGHLRTVITGETPGIPGARAVGSYDVLNGNRAGSYDAQRKIFHTFPFPPEVAPLAFLAWKGGYPDWEKVCGGPAGQVLPDVRVAGRDARHLRCTDPVANVWQLWIDRQTGLVLKIAGQTGGGGDFFLDSAPLTSQHGGFSITRLRYHPTFPPGTFRIAAPSGALDFEARLRAAEAKVPPFRALISTRSHRRRRVEHVWWRDNNTWRLGFENGDFAVAAHGNLRRYDAHNNTYSTGAISGKEGLNPVINLLREDDPSYPRDCPIIGRDRVGGRPAVHRRCPDDEIWVDAATGLILQETGLGWALHLRNLHYHPTFPAGTFRFSKPAGSRNSAHVKKGPYFGTELKAGQPAPDWHARLLDGHRFQITDLRGKPALILVFSDTCPPGDPICDVFTGVERVYKEFKDKFTVIWVDLQGSAVRARKIAQHNHLTLPVVIDSGFPGTVEKAWKIQSYPYWVLLDSHGRVIEGRPGTQTLAQLRQLIAKAN